MESDSEEELTWVKVDNTVKERMIDSSLIHKLVPRKLQKRTKILNKKIAKMSNITSYSQYVSIKTDVLRDCSDNDETDEEIMSDYEYSTLYKSEEFLKNYMSKSSESLWQNYWEDEYESTKALEKNSKKKLKVYSRSNRRKNMSHVTNKKQSKEKDSADIDVGWRNVSRKSQTSSQMRKGNYSNCGPCKSSACMERESTMTDNESMNKSERDDRLDPLDNNSEEGSARKKQKLIKDVEPTTSPEKCTAEENEGDIGNSFNTNWNYSWDENNDFLRQNEPLQNTAMAGELNITHSRSSLNDTEHQPKDSGIDEDSQEESSRDGKNNTKVSRGQLLKENSDIVGPLSGQSVNPENSCKIDDVSEELSHKVVQKLVHFVIGEAQHSTPIKHSESNTHETSVTQGEFEKMIEETEKFSNEESAITACSSVEEEEQEETILENKESTLHEEEEICNDMNTANTSNEMKDNVDEKHNEEIMNESGQTDNSEGNNDTTKILLSPSKMPKIKLPPKVMRTEVVNQKYKIICKEQINEHNYKEVKAVNNTEHESNDSTCVYDEEASKSEPGTGSDAVHEESCNIDETLRLSREELNEHITTVDNETAHVTFSDRNCETVSDLTGHCEQGKHNVNIRNDDKKVKENRKDETVIGQSSLIHALRKKVLFRSEDEDEDSDDNAAPSMSPRAVQRLQQLKRLNLITGSDSSSDDDERLQKRRQSQPIQIDGPIMHKKYKQEAEEVQCKYENVSMNDTLKIKKDDDDQMRKGLYSADSKEDLEKDYKENRKTSVLSLKRPMNKKVSQINDEQKEELQGSINTILTDSPSARDSLETASNLAAPKTVKNNFDSHNKEQSARQHKSRKRPSTLDDITRQEELSVCEIGPSFTLKEMDDNEEVFILNLPNTVDLRSLRNEKMVLKTNKLKIGNQKFKIMHTNTDAVTCVFHKGKKHVSYKTVSIKPVATIVARRKLSKLTEVLRIEQSPENDDFVVENSSKKRKKIKQ